MALATEICRVAGIRKITIDYPPKMDRPFTKFLFQKSHMYQSLTIESREPEGKQLELFKDKPNVQFW